MDAIETMNKIMDDLYDVIDDYEQNKGLDIRSTSFPALTFAVSLRLSAKINEMYDNDPSSLSDKNFITLLINDVKEECHILIRQTMKQLMAKVRSQLNEKKE